MPLDIHSLTDADFDALPLVVEGESKIVRDAGEGLCVIRYKPTIYSFTQNRAAWVEGSNILRLKATRVFLEVLRAAGIDHAYVDVGERYVLSRLIQSPPPIEVIIKAFHSGTSKHRYYGMGKKYRVRASHPYFGGRSFGPEDGYPTLVVRFDWRNPMWHPEKVAAQRKRAQEWLDQFESSPGMPKEMYEWPADERRKVMLADEVLCDAQADWFIAVEEAKMTALRTFTTLQDFLAERDVILYDLCLFITEDGKTVFGEISQDCGRFRHFDLGSLDKDVWRAGGSSEAVLEKWGLLLKVIS